MVPDIACCVLTGTVSPCGSVNTTVMNPYHRLRGQPFKAPPRDYLPRDAFTLLRTTTPAGCDTPAEQLLPPPPAVDGETVAMQFCLDWTHHGRLRTLNVTFTWRLAHIRRPHASTHLPRDWTVLYAFPVTTYATTTTRGVPFATAGSLLQRRNTYHCAFVDIILHISRFRTSPACTLYYACNHTG